MTNKKRHNIVSMRARLIGVVGKVLIDALFMGSRIEVHGRQPLESLLASNRYIIASWHARIALISYAHKGSGGAALVSNSADGEIMAQILQRQGQATVRGSTTRGGSRALVQLIKEMRFHHRPGGLIPDGPQGPPQKVQPGVIYLAQKTGYPIIPVTYSARRRKVFNSWDRFILPYPATAHLLIYGTPIFVPPDGDAAQIQRCTQALEDEMNRITDAADAYFGHPISLP